MEKKFDSNKLYNGIVHYYVDKKKYSKDDANRIAQKVIQREIHRRTCKNSHCRHSIDKHIRDQSTCLVLECDCTSFLK